MTFNRRKGNREGEASMSKHVPDTAEANAGLATGREASRRDHQPYDIRHMDDVEWETIR